MGINAKKQKPEKISKENNAKEKLERDLRSCMKCKYFGEMITDVLIMKNVEQESKKQKSSRRVNV